MEHLALLVPVVVQELPALLDLRVHQDLVELAAAQEPQALLDLQVHLVVQVHQA